MKSYLLGSLNVKSFISVDDKQAESSQLAQLHCNTSSMAGWLLMTSSLANLAGFYLHGETVQLRVEKFIVLQMCVGNGEKDLKFSILGCPAQDNVEPGPAVLQEVGDGPLVSSSSWSTVGHQGDVSVM